MNRLSHILQAMGKAAKIAVVFVSVIALFWFIGYRLVLGFTPLWLDLATAGATAIATLILWRLGRGRPFHYSAPIKKPSD
jgi:hypothetical protein